MRGIYNIADTPRVISATTHLAAYLYLLHVVGPEALPRKVIHFGVNDVDMVWRASSPALQAYLERDGEAIVCKGLGTRFFAAA